MEFRHICVCLIVVLVFSTRTCAQGQDAEFCINTIVSPNGVLTYPANAQNYTNNLNCTWIFNAPDGRVVEITFTIIDLEAPIDGFCYDKITVYDGIVGSPILSNPFCGDGPFWPRLPTRYLSTSDTLSIQMSTDASVTGTGFQLQYKHVKFRIEAIAGINVDIPSIIEFNRFSAFNFETTPLLQSRRPSALDFDPITEFFYYSDIEIGFIGRIKYGGSFDEILVEEGVLTPLDVAVGYLTGLLYWTDTVQEEVSVSSLDGRFRKKILLYPNTGCNSPRSITLSMDQQHVFWTCTDKILKANADGSGSETLVHDVAHPAAIVVDEDKFLYYVDTFSESVSRIKIDGSDKEFLFTHDYFSDVHSFVLDSFTYYFSRPAGKHILDVDRHDPAYIMNFRLSQPATIEGLYYYKSDQTIAQQHPCATGAARCDELCFPQGSSYSCVEVSPVVIECPSDIKVSTSGPFQEVSWDEPIAMSRTSPQSGTLLRYNARSSVPGDLFHVGSTQVVTYMFTDDLGNNANCTFTVVLSLATTPTPTKATTRATTSVTPTTTPSNVPAITMSQDESFINEYLPYVIVASVIVVICIVISIVVVVTCCCGCWNCNRRSPVRSPSTSKPPSYVDSNSNTAINMGPVGVGRQEIYMEPNRI